jgi:hypothetical protein
MADNVFINDVNLVCLYRYTNFTDSGAEVLDNSTESTVYTGLNTMSVSGGIEKVEGPGANAPSSSGARASGGGIEIFHLPRSPAQSGNASGIDISSSQDHSFGGWFLSPFTSDFEDFMGKWAIAAGARSYAMQGRTGTSPSRFWRAEIGASNGGSTATVDSPFTAAENAYEHVVCTVDADTATNNVRLYVSGILVASGSITVSPGTSGAHPPFRILGNSAGASESVLNGISSAGGQVAETFFMNRTLTSGEVAGVFASGFVAVPAAGSGFFNSDEQDTLKDNVGPQSASTSSIPITAWNGNERADPSGFRHMTSGSHPGWLKILEVGGGSGLNFGQISQGTASGIRAITFRNATTGTKINNMKFWAYDLSAFNGIVGYDIALHIDSKWLPNLTLPSGSGVVGRSLAAASSVLRSDGHTEISGYSLAGHIPSGEQEISQYIYLSFDTNSDFTPNTYGPTGFEFRVTADNLDV